jgi:hypothetical protein
MLVALALIEIDLILIPPQVEFGMPLIIFSSTLVRPQFCTLIYEKKNIYSSICGIFAPKCCVMLLSTFLRYLIFLA